MDKFTSVADRWVEVLKEGGYEPPPVSKHNVTQLARFTRIWKRLHRLLDIKAGETFFEFGCGGGQHLIPLALQGHSVTGIDASNDVLQRCQSYVAQVEKLTERRLPITLVHGDFLEYETKQQYDVVFNFGVIEHFLDDTERLAAVRKMVQLTRPGGHIVSVVPNGIHPLRARQRAENLGGYDIPEIDYDDQIATAELLEAGATNPAVFPANLFGYLRMDTTNNRLATLRNTLGFYAAQFVPLARTPFMLRHAGSLIIVGQPSVDNAVVV